MLMLADLLTATVPHQPADIAANTQAGGIIDLVHVQRRVDDGEARRGLARSQSLDHVHGPQRSTSKAEHVCTCRCTFTHAQTPMHIYPCTNTHAQTPMHKHPCACTHAHMYTHAHAPMHMHPCTYTHAHTPMHIHPCRYVHPCTNTHAHTPMHIHPCTYVHPCTCTHMYVYTHGCMHAHTLSCFSAIIWWYSSNAS